MSVITSERMLRTNPLRRLLVRPETGAVAGAIAVWIFFAIVAVGTAYILVSATTGITSIVTNGLTVVNGIDQAPGYSSAHAIFATALGGGQQFPIEILWALALVALATWLLLGTSFGNWIFGVGGDAHAARNIGVPVTRVKILLFIGTAVCSCLLAIILDVKFTNADVLRGQGNEFYAIVAAVVGGVLLTGGYGSAIGAMFGALVFGIVEEGIVFAGVNAEWYKAVIGLILLLAVLLNSYVRKLAMEARR